MILNKIQPKLLNLIQKRVKLIANYCKDREPDISLQQQFHLHNGPDDIATGKQGVRTIHIDTPSNKNALSINMMKRLIFSIKLDNDDPNLRCIVITSGSKGKIFSSGHDLKELSKTSGSEIHKEVFDTAEKLMEAIITSPVPVIAKVDGHAAASGCQLVAQCDLAVCSNRSKFSTPGINVGIFCSTPSIPLIRNIPRKKALEMLFTGAVIDAAEAYRIGLVNKVVPAEKLDEEVNKLVDSIMEKSRDVVELGKRFVYEQVEMKLMEAYDRGSKVMQDNLGMKDAEEGIDAFIGKRKPKWLSQLPGINNNLKTK